MLDENSKRKVDTAVNRMNINIEAPPEQQEDMVEKILQLVAPDRPNDRVKRLQNLVKEIHMCTRKTTEDPAVYTSRFEGLAHDYLSQSSGQQGQLESQIFALMLIDNAKLPAQTVNALTLQLTADAKQRAVENDPIVYISFSQLSSLVDMITYAKESYGSIQQVDACLLTDLSKNADDALKILRSYENMTRSQAALHPIYLDDAATALRKLEMTETVDDCSRQLQELKTSMMTLKRKHNLQFAGSHGNIDEGSFRIQQPQSFKSIKERKLVTSCASCGKKGHWWADRDCPNHEKNMHKAKRSKITGQHDRMCEQLNPGKNQDKTQINKEKAENSSRQELDDERMSFFQC